VVTFADFEQKETFFSNTYIFVEKMKNILIFVNKLGRPTMV